MSEWKARHVWGPIMANKTYNQTNKDSDLHHSNHNKFLGVSQSCETEGALYKYRKSPIFSQKEQGRVVYCYGVASVSRIDKIISLFCKRAL